MEIQVQGIGIVCTMYVLSWHDASHIVLGIAHADLAVPACSAGFVASVLQQYEGVALASTAVAVSLCFLIWHVATRQTHQTAVAQLCKLEVMGPCLGPQTYICKFCFGDCHHCHRFHTCFYTTTASLLAEGQS